MLCPSEEEPPWSRAIVSPVLWLWAKIVSAPAGISDGAKKAESEATGPEAVEWTGSPLTRDAGWIVVATSASTADCETGSSWGVDGELVSGLRAGLSAAMKAG